MFRALAPRLGGPGRQLRWAGEIARSLFGVLLIVAAALYWASPIVAVAASASAIVAGATALQDSRHGRVSLVLGVSLGLGVTVFLGYLTAGHDMLYVPTVLLWCFAAGMAWAVSANAGLLAAAASIVLLAAPTTATFVETVSAAAFAVAAGILQVLLVAAWPRQRWHHQRRALVDAYAWVASCARRLAIDPDAVLDPTPLIELRESFALTERQARRRPPAYRGLYALPERIAMTLNALRVDAAVPQVHAVLLAAADVLGAISHRSEVGRSDAEIALRRLDDCVADLSGSSLAPAQRLRSQLSEAAVLHFTGVALPAGAVERFRPVGVAAAVIAARTAITTHLLDRDSPILRHAVRLAIAATIGTVSAHIFGLGDGYWVALTVLLVVRPETAHTYTRCVTRIGAVLAGVLVATTIAILVQPAGLLAAVLAVLFVALSYAVVGFGSVPVTASLAAAIVFLIDIAGSADTDTLGERTAAILLGGALAVASHVALPDRSLVRIRQRSGELLRAEIEYAATVIRSFVHHLDHREEALSTVWERATRARSAFEAASGSMRADAPRVRRWLTAYRAALNAVTGVCATLEDHVPDAQKMALDPRFVVAVDDYVDALRGELPSAGQPWMVDARHLAEADQQLRDAAALLGKQDAAQRVLVAETEAITRHLLNVAQLA